MIFFSDSGGFVSHAPNSVVAVKKRPLPNLPLQPEPSRRTVGLNDDATLPSQVRLSQNNLTSTPQNDLTNSRFDFFH